MRVSKLKDFLEKMYFAGSADGRVAVLLLGPPGVGKSYTVYEVAKEVAKKADREFVDYNDDVAPEILAEPERYFVFVDLRLTEVEPSDLIGIPKVIDGAVHYKPLLWARCLNKAPGILFLDELTNVQRLDVLSAAYKLILDRKAGFTPFHRDVMVIAAGNSPEHSAIANMLPAPLVDRLMVVDVAPPTVREWAEFMSKVYGDRWDRRTLAFLLAFEAEHYLLKPTKDVETLTNFPTPRSWTSLALLLQKGVAEPEEVAVGLLGPEVGHKFAAFLRTRVDLEQLIREPQRFAELHVDQKYMAATMLGSWVSRAKEKNISRCFGLVDAMAAESREYLVVACLSTTRQKLFKFLKELFRYNTRYREVLGEVTALKSAIEVG